MQVVAINPMAETRPDEKVIPEESFMQRHRKVFKSLGALGVLAVVGVVGFLAGSSAAGNGDSSAPGTTTGTDGGDTENGIDAALTMVKSAFVDPANLALTNELNITQIDELLDQYEADPVNWNDQYMTVGIMQAFQRLRDGHRQETIAAGIANRRQLRDGYRELSSLSDPLVNLAYEQVEEADYSGAVQYGDDFVLVKRASGYCFVIAQESNSASDWFENLNLGSDDIKSIGTYSVQDESCGCAKKTWWWCSTYKTCSTSTTIGRGYDGFVKAYNAMRTAIWSRIQSTCASTDVKVLTGYSRGAAINTVLAFALRKESLVPASKLALITFGSPRVLEDSDSDFLHNQNFPSYRMIYKKDPVPSLPYGWMGFKHTGDMICHQCGYSGRDKPSWSWPTDAGDHTSYCKFFGDKACE